VIEPVVITGRRDYGIVGIRSLTSAFRMTYVIAVATRQRWRRLVSALRPLARTSLEGTRFHQIRASTLQPISASSRTASNRSLGEAMKRLKQLLIVLTLNIVWGSCWVSSANAGGITMGTWTTTGSSDHWNDVSLEYPELNAEQVSTSWEGTEYLNAAAPIAFAFNGSEFYWETTPIDASINGSDSLITSGQFSSFHPGGRERSFHFFSFKNRRPNASNDDDHEGSVPTPEPGTLVLMLCGGLAAFRQVRSRKS